MAQCTATSKQTGEQCRRFASPGAKTCKWHGSATGSAKAAAKRRVEEQAAREAATRFGVPVDVSPTEALIQEVQRAAGLVAFYQRIIEGLDEKQLATGVVETKIDADGRKSYTLKTAPSIWLDLHDRERRRLVEACTAALRAGVEERVVRLAEQQGDLLADAIEAILARLDLDQAQLDSVPDIVPGVLREISTGGVTPVPARARPRPAPATLARTAADDALTRAGMDLNDPRVRWAADAAVAAAMGEPVPAPPRLAVAAIEAAAPQADPTAEAEAAVSAPAGDRGGPNGAGVDPVDPPADAEAPTAATAPPSGTVDEPLEGEVVDPDAELPTHRSPAARYGGYGADPRQPGSRPGWGANR